MQKRRSLIYINYHEIDNNFEMCTYLHKHRWLICNRTMMSSLQGNLQQTSYTKVGKFSYSYFPANALWDDMKQLSAVTTEV